MHLTEAEVAHDVGSAAAQLMVTGAPQRVQGLVILDGVYETEWAMSAIDGIRTWEVGSEARG